MNALILLALHRFGVDALVGCTLHTTAYFPVDIFGEFVTVKFLGKFAVLVPAQSEGFLTVAYGDWRTPQKQWDFLYGPMNLVREKKEGGERG
jgi:hypothetical protein